MNLKNYAIGAGLFAAACAPLTHAGGDIPAMTTELVASGLSDPLYVTHAPNDFDRIFIVEQLGRIRVRDQNTGTLSVFLDIQGTVLSGGERGLLGLAFHPNYAENGYFYVSYTGSGGTSHVARYSVSTADPNVADANSGQILISVSQPFSNHNGGWIGFSPNDGYLYYALGDGGSGGDPGNRAQNTNLLLGKMLRIDVDGTNGSTGNYGIPADNPFVGADGRDEIWAYGLRNPWRCSFDRETGDLWMADVGQNSWEEINRERASSTGGENYGWRCYEGNNPYNLSGCPDSSTMTFPVHTYSRSGGNCSITGGVIYRGVNIPGLEGTYFYGDYCSSRVWSFEYSLFGGVSNFTERTSEIGSGLSGLGSFGEDAYGEIYMCSLFNGRVYKIVPQDGPFTDCNGNGIEDAAEILDGSESDTDGNGIIDSCETSCEGDVTGDNNVDLADLNLVLANFGSSTSEGDVDGNGEVDLADLNLVLANFGSSC
ncbi:MAG: PQQ-dependent sugar dehydrogenase [Phycisphaerales bacterium JB050]